MAVNSISCSRDPGDRSAPRIRELSLELNRLEMESATMAPSTATTRT